MCVCQVVGGGGGGGGREVGRGGGGEVGRGGGGRWTPLLSCHHVSKTAADIGNSRFAQRQFKNSQDHRVNTDMFLLFGQDIPWIVFNLHEQFCFMENRVKVASFVFISIG